MSIIKLRNGKSIKLSKLSRRRNYTKRALYSIIPRLNGLRISEVFTEEEAYKFKVAMEMLESVVDDDNWGNNSLKLNILTDYQRNKQKLESLNKLK